MRHKLGLWLYKLSCWVGGEKTKSERITCSVIDGEIFLPDDTPSEKYWVFICIPKEPITIRDYMSNYPIDISENILTYDRQAAMESFSEYFSGY